MDPRRFRHLDGFSELSPAALAVVARHARSVALPPGRWLIRPGRSLPDQYYLLNGRVRLLRGGRHWVVEASSSTSLNPVYPGAAGVQALSSAEFLSIAPEVLEELRQHPEIVPLGAPQLDPADGSWQGRFLTSPLMRRLTPAAWQRVLRAMTRHDFAAGEVVIAAGEPGACCYVLSAGGAEIIGAGGGRLATLQPGALFGEDALLCGAGRNATVRMTADGEAVSLAAERFECWLVEAVTPAIESAQGRQLLCVDEPSPTGMLPVSLAGLRTAARRLPAEAAYAVCGGSLRQRRLAAFLLAEQGLDVRPLAS